MEAAAAQVRGDGPDVCNLVEFHPQQAQAGAGAVDPLERHAGETQEAGRVRGGGEALGEGCLHQVEVGLRLIGWRRLPEARAAGAGPATATVRPRP